MADTALDVIKDALRDLGVLGKGQDIDEDDAARALQRMDDMLDSWSIQPYAIYAWSDITHTLVSGSASYTIGPTGADITAARPIQIIQAFVRDDNAYDYPVDVISYSDYMRITDKTTDTTYPNILAYNAGHPNGTVYIWPVADTANTLHMIAESVLSNLATTSATFTFPPGYRIAVVKNLALQLAPMFAVNVAPDLKKQAEAAMAAIKRANNRNRSNGARIDSVLLAMGSGRGGYNWRTDN